MTTTPGPGPTPGLVELRQYTLRPGRRDELVELFDRELVETQDAVGSLVLGQLRDLDRPDRFVWLRGFTDGEARGRALSAFYGGPVWAAHADAANATMIDWDDVLLTTPLRPLALPPRRGEGPSSLPVVVSTHAVHHRAALEAEDERSGLLGLLATVDVDNTFPALPVRAHEDLLVRIARTPPTVPALQVVRGAPTPRSWLR